MSPKQHKTVRKLVEKYRRQFPSLERPLLRRLIRLEHPELFKDNPSMSSNLKTLDRHLRKAFENKEPPSPSKPKKPEASRFGFFDYLKWRRQYEDERLGKSIEELEEDVQKLWKEMEEDED